MRNAALLRFRGEHENLPEGRKGASEGEHMGAIYPIVVRDEDARFLHILHALGNVENL
jgi:hypothetical protein